MQIVSGGFARPYWLLCPTSKGRHYFAFSVSSHRHLFLPVSPRQMQIDLNVVPGGWSDLWNYFPSRVKVVQEGICDFSRGVQKIVQVVSKYFKFNITPDVPCVLNQCVKIGPRDRRVSIKLSKIRPGSIKSPIRYQKPVKRQQKKRNDRKRR